jgi:hypothetical protein
MIATAPGWSVKCAGDPTASARIRMCRFVQCVGDMCMLVCVGRNNETKE